MQKDMKQNGEVDCQGARRNKIVSKFDKQYRFFFYVAISGLCCSRFGPLVSAFTTIGPTIVTHSRSAGALNRHIPTYNLRPTSLHVAAPLDLDEPKSLVNDFQPMQMTLTESMVFFADYLYIHRKEQAVKKQLMNPNSMRSKLWPSRVSIKDFSKLDAKRLRAEVEQDKLEKKPFLETLEALNKSRKELIELVGYDTKLLVSSFGFAVLAAFMNSVIPHYYGQSVHCLATALTTQRTEVVTALTGLGIASILCALFTGIRGALFWLAGMCTHCLQSMFS